jgi:hypothetical protein
MRAGLYILWQARAVPKPRGAAIPLPAKWTCPRRRRHSATRARRASFFPSRRGDLVGAATKEKEDGGPGDRGEVWERRPVGTVSFWRRGLPILLMTAGLAHAAPARAVAFDCPHRPGATFILSEDLDEMRAEFERLAEAAKGAGQVCIRAYYDNASPSWSRVFAFRRANWAREHLMANGVPENAIIRVLHPSTKAREHLVEVVLGP